MMNIKIKESYSNNEHPIVIGCPSHLNQMHNFDEIDQILGGQLENLKTTNY